ncbi:hypothetical protein ACIRJS_16530 [Streptomyces sp. NPDC102340]|uniref:hypothetical protein n=1 Tax=unclassified Streptomyces TaxID=2593676 RepID=UPI0037F9FD7F
MNTKEVSDVRDPDGHLVEFSLTAVQSLVNLATEPRLAMPEQPVILLRTKYLRADMSDMAQRLHDARADLYHEQLARAADRFLKTSEKGPRRDRYRGDQPSHYDYYDLMIRSANMNRDLYEALRKLPQEHDRRSPVE